MQIEKIRQGNAQRVEEFEKQSAFSLPDDYKQFLAEYDGAIISNHTFYVEALQDSVLMDILYGITAEGRFNIKESNEFLEGEIPEKSICIGEDPGGLPLLLICDGENDGIWYYDFRYFFDKSTDEENTYFVASTFTEFMASLKKYKEE